MIHIYEYLKNSAEKFSEKVAFADLHTAISYGELLNRTNRIAGGLLDAVSVGEPVAVFMDKSVSAVCAFMGVARAGGFYVMLDTKQPEVRLNQILDTLKPKVLITDDAGGLKVSRLGFEGSVLKINELAERPVMEEALLEREALYRDVNPLYGIFTSGSTGEPKGVIVNHRSVIDFIGYFVDLFHITSQDVIGNQAPFDFDVSVKDIYSALKSGATMEIIPKQFFSFPTKLLDFLCERKVTTLIWAVSALCMVTTLKGFQYKVPADIRKVMFSGEAMPVKHLEEWRTHIPEAMYVNLYGPTEITCNCTYHVIEEKEFGPAGIPMGRPFPNEKVFLLDDDDRLIGEAGKKGELCVSGTALAPGYYNNREQTEKVFVQNPLNTQYPEIIYRTGDLASYGEDGLLYFGGRRDYQIKHMGHRIELGEIQCAMEAVQGIDRAVCIFDEKEHKILGFYQGDLPKKELVRGLSKILPAFMIPNVFIQKEAFPVTKNGKVDRKELMAEYES